MENHAVLEVRFQNIFIDGTKIEANANKYTFVWKKATDKFEFTIAATTVGAPMPAETTVVNAEDGTITFAPIPFNAEGTYE